MVSFPKISPNLLLGVGGVIALVFFVNQIRKAGGDLAKTFTDVQPAAQVEQIVGTIQESLSDISLPSISLPDIFATPEPVIPSDPTQQTPQQQEDIFGRTLTEQEEQTIVDIDKALTEGTALPDTGFASLLKEFNPPNIFGFGFLGVDKKGITESLAKELGIFDFTTADISEQQIFELSKIGQGIQDVETIFELFPTREDILFSAAFDVDRPVDEPATIQTVIQAPTPEPTVVSLLPTDQQFQAFSAEGSQAAEFTIRENPIDTLSEVIDAFPELTASQAADFLAATGGTILPSQVEAGTIDPDIRNIVAGFVGGGQDQAVPVSQTPTEIDAIREAENLKAAEFTCREFGLNCDLVDSTMA